MSKLTKKSIEAAVLKATGVSAELDKNDGLYYWCGDAAIFFDETCLFVTELNWPGVTVQWFVDNFVGRVEDAEKRSGRTIAEMVQRLNTPRESNEIIRGRF